MLVHDCFSRFRYISTYSEMCRWCYVVNEDVVIPPIASRYNGRMLNDPIIVRKGEHVFHAIRNSVEDAFELRAVYNHFLFERLPSLFESSGCYQKGSNSTKSQARPPTGIADEFFEFESALEFLTLHNPTRMKALEQLELNYHKAIQQVKQERVSAISSLQTRQSLEMDMLTSAGQCDKRELEALVSQHVAEMDAVVAHWDKELSSLHRRQLAEYKELVMEVYCSEKSLSQSARRSDYNIAEYRRPEIPGLRWQSLVPVSVSTHAAFRTRLVRLTHMEGDFIESVIVPVLPDADPRLDPEEQVLAAPSKVKSAVVLGCHAGFEFKSNQDAALSKIVDLAAPGDCRWPSLAEQRRAVAGSAGESKYVVTRHSNLGHGVVAIFHCMSESSISEIVEWCDCMHIERLFLPHAIVPDLLAPGASSEQSDLVAVTISAVRRLSNVVSDPGLRELVIVSPAGTNV